MNFLCLDSSSKTLSLAIIHDGKILASYNDLPSEPQSKVIINIIDSVFKKANITVDQIGQVLFCNGPGSFTSLRVGLATLQGLFLKNSVRFFVTSSLLLRCLNGQWAKLPLGRDRMAVGLLSESFKEQVPAHIQGAYQQRITTCQNYYEGFLSGESLTEMNKIFPALSNIAPDDVCHTNPAAFLTILKNKWCEETSLAEARLFYMIEPDVGPPRSF